MNWRHSSRREWALAVGGGLALATVLVLVLRPPAATPPPAPATVATMPAQPAAALPAAPSLPAMLLTGLRAGPDGGSATVLLGGNRQALLRPGRPLPGQPAVGGWRLDRVEATAAILVGPGGAVQRLAFAETTAAAAAGMQAGGAATAWRIALSPRRGPGGIEGWVLGDPATVPALARAGLKRGDLLIEAGGTPLISEEKIIELPQELAANGQLAVRYRRDGVTAVVMLRP